MAIFVQTPEQALRDAAMAAEAGADMVEFRIDRVRDRVQVARLVSESILPCIITCRAAWEGGECDLPEEDRFALIPRPVESPRTYVDLELKAVAKLATELDWAPQHLIVSSHDFAGRPARLNNIMLELRDTPAAVNKIVWTARTIRDNLEAFEILRQRTRPTIALCMGEAGLMSRVLAKKFGAFLTFCSLGRASATAPGQVTVEDMKHLYRWDALSSGTRIFGVVGNPVSHSMSPAIHNAAFDAVHYDGVYLPLPVNDGYESFKAFMEDFLAFDPLDLTGLSVTIPHKENALRYLRERGAEVDPMAQSIGAVNTIAVDRAGRGIALRGFNTDYAAILDSITAKLGLSREGLSGRRAAVLGAGGTARSAVAGLCHYGASVVIYNRTLERAARLAQEMSALGQVTAEPLQSFGREPFDIIINTTSAGMHPRLNDSPLESMPKWLSPDTLVFDAIYNPMETRLLRMAKASGAKTVGGIEMFVRQAVLQFEAWTGIPAPAGVMREVVERRLESPDQQ